MRAIVSDTRVRVILGVGETAGFQGVVVGVVGLRAKWLDWAAR